MFQVGDQIVTKRALRHPDGDRREIKRGATGTVTKVINRGELLAVSLDSYGELVVYPDAVQHIPRHSAAYQPFAAPRDWDIKSLVQSDGLSAN